MRKLKLQVQMTLDGYIAGPNGEMDWVTFNGDDALKKYAGVVLHYASKRDRRKACI